MSVNDMLEHLSAPVKQAVDMLSVGALIAVLVSWLPSVTALLVLIWTILRVYESVLTIKLKRKELRRD